MIERRSKKTRRVDNNLRARITQWMQREGFWTSSQEGTLKGSFAEIHNRDHITGYIACDKDYSQTLNKRS